MFSILSVSAETYEPFLLIYGQAGSYHYDVFNNSFFQLIMCFNHVFDSLVKQFIADFLSLKRLAKMSSVRKKF